ncbi:MULTISPECIES: hypothetical protein [unclassified Duganella]|uniref:hypothetical protein n=1 Tax=unclassified Duganella TaxID=2636909 RepID=UPI0006FE88D9|nr:MULTISPECIES: hypothetical protein [unclassified Duganella]KQV50993.1 hypothetical protein ASD07_08705 [Duganella sp. Root336D2]KRC00571.1 hypothetical protein ASE26_22905 [Duganella sp. Root198D2]
MKTMNLFAAVLGLCLAAATPAGWGQQTTPGQDKPEARQQAKATVKGESSSAARKATGLQEPKKEGQAGSQPDRRERAMQVSGSLQKKTNETASAAASNVK